MKINFWQDSEYRINYWKKNFLFNCFFRSNHSIGFWHFFGFSS